MCVVAKVVLGCQGPEHFRECDITPSKGPLAKFPPHARFTHVFLRQSGNEHGSADRAYTFCRPESCSRLFLEVGIVENARIFGDSTVRIAMLEAC